MRWKPGGAMAVACVVLCVQAVRGGSSDDPLGRALAATYLTADAVRESTSGRREAEKRVKEAEQAFDAGLRAAADEIAPNERAAALASEAGSLREKLQAIAIDRESRPEVYEELLDAYVRPHPEAPEETVGGVAIVSAGRSPTLSVRPEHEVERYRLAWEYFLLNPGFLLNTSSPRAMLMPDLALRALAKIGDPASAIVVLHAAKVADTPLALGVLVQMPSRAAADAILDVLAIANEQWKDLPAGYRDWTELYVAYVRNLSPAKRRAWTDLLEETGVTSPAFGALSRRIQASLDIERALNATRVTCPWVEAEVHDPALAAERLDQASRDLDAALVSASEDMPGSQRRAAIAGDSLWIASLADLSAKAKLAAIAVDRADRPKVYQELGRAYLTRPESSGPEVALKRQYAKETYRLAWELLLLTPGPRGAWPAYEIRAADALAAIANPASVSTLFHGIGVITQDGVPLTPEVAELQRRLLDTLLAIPSKAASEAIVYALVGIGHQQQLRRRRGEREALWDAKTHVVERILSMPAAEQDAWLAAAPENWSVFRELRARLKESAGAQQQSAQ